MVLGNLIIYQNGAIREFEKPEVCEAINVANANRWTVYLTPIEWDDREARLKKEHEKHANASDKMGMTLKEAKDLLKKEFEVIGIHKSTEPFEFDESRWIEHEKPSVLEAFRVLSKEGYYVTISGHDYNMREKRLKKEHEENTKDPDSAENHIKEDSVVNPALKEAASQFNEALLDEQAKKIEELTKDKELMKKASLSQLDDFIEIYNLLTKESQKAKRLGKEIAKLNGIIHDKNAVLSDVAEELRLTKIREKNLAELGLKYVGENEKLKKKLADKVVDKIDARALKSAESALAYKEKVIAEKDDVIADLGKELAATKKELEEKTKRVGIIRNASKEYCDYGVAANEFIKELASLYVLANNKGIINDEMLERCKNYQTYGFPANCNRETKKEINDIARGNENKKLSLFRDDSVGAVTNQKDCSPIKDTHPTEDKPEEVELDEILECVRKALEEGHTVSIKYDEADEDRGHYVTWESNI